MAAQPTIPLISVCSASLADVEQCVKQMWEEILSKEVPEGQTPELLARYVRNSCLFSQLYQMKSGDIVLAFGLVLTQGTNHHLYSTYAFISSGLC
jgi:hypothetical protein